MTGEISSAWPWVLLAVAICAAFVTRAFGVVVSGRVRPETPLFHWFACVGQAMVGGLMVRAIFLPSTALGEAPTVDRALALGVGVAAFFVSGRRLLIGTLSGVGALALLMVWRSAGG